jgi:pimeloyl-ACP methyl ester carboxylesterase
MLAAWEARMKKLCHILLILLAALVATPAAAQGDVTGDWHGTLTTPSGSLRLQITLRAGADGALTGELEIPDQAPGRKRPMSTVSVADGRLRFVIPSGNISYEGAWNASTQRFDGTFRQGVELPLAFARGSFPASPTVPGLDGHWDGRAERNGATLHFVLRISTGPRGTVASFDSPDQMAMNLQVSDLTRQGETIRFSLAGGATTFTGTLTGDRLSGRWTDGTETSFVRRAGAANEASSPRRPQLPQPPFPYRVEEVRVTNPRAPGVTLAGTLTLPQGQGPFPAAILISGSGPQDRDESLMRHKPFAVLADHLTRRGIAVLRYDDRGTGQSTGSFTGATSADFATDANAAFAFLAARPEIDRRAIGFVGHSEGGLIGPVAARDNAAVAFLVLLAGPGVPMRELLEAQRMAIAQSQGLSQAEIARTAPLQAELMAAAASELDDAGVRARLAASLTEARLQELGLTVAQRDAMIGAMLDPWLRWLLRYDPAPALRAFRGPILALNGTLDRQVLPASNLAGIRAATAGNRDVTITELPRLNHLFQTAETGGIGEYARIEETMAPLVLETVATWIRARFVERR